MTQYGERAPDVRTGVALTNGPPCIHFNCFHSSRFRTTTGTSPPYECESDSPATHGWDALPLERVRGRDANS